VEEVELEARTDKSLFVELDNVELSASIVKVKCIKPLYKGVAGFWTNLVEK
jgi:hypothetical protein